MAHAIRYTWAVLLSWIQALGYRGWMSVRPIVRPRVMERRQNPRACALCGGPMRSDRRPPRDVRSPDGKIRRLPEETLHWFRCSRCHLSQVGAS